MICWPHCDDDGDPCYDPWGFYICDPWNLDPENPEESYVDCAGIEGEWAYIAPCGCIGGSTGIWDCPNQDTTENDPCEAIRRANLLKNDANISNEIDNIKNNTSETGYKLFVSDPTDPNTYYIGPGIGGGNSSWASNFTWNANHGYGIGHLHNHPQGSAPNPSDAMVGIDLDQMKSLHTSSEVDFYTKNFSAIIVAGSEVYTITIKDAAQYKLDQKAYDADRALSASDWLSKAQGYITSNPSATPQEAGVYALLEMYGNSINLSRQGINSNNSNVELSLNSNNNVITKNPC